MRPDFLAIGHVARDLAPDGFRVGGTVTYAALTAGRMGLSVAVVTSVGPELDVPSAMPGVQVHVVPSSDTTTFHNSYRHGKRSQLIKGVAAPIGASDVPQQWLSAPLVMLGPLAGEVSYDLAKLFPDATVMASLQGWLRQWDDVGRVSQAHWEGEEVLPHLDAAICSIGEIADRDLIDLWKPMVPILVVTMGREGARIHFEGSWHHVPAFPTREVDPTGAGDVFAAAYMIRYRETGDPLESARFASCAASFCVESEDVAGIPIRAQVEARLNKNAHQAG